MEESAANGINEYTEAAYCLSFGELEKRFKDIMYEYASSRGVDCIVYKDKSFSTWDHGKGFGVTFEWYGLEGV